MSSAFGLAFGLIIALNIMAINQHAQLPMQVNLPCPDKICDFSTLTQNMDADTVAFLEYMWTTRLLNLDVNVTELYFCGSNANVQFDPCNLTQYYCILGFLLGSLLLISIYGCVYRFNRFNLANRRRRLTVVVAGVDAPSQPSEETEPPGYEEKN